MLRLKQTKMSEMTPDEFWSVLHAMPEPVTLSYRLYYSAAGEPVIYSMEELSGNYIEVDQETYALAPFNVQVIDNKIVYIKPVITVKKLYPTVSKGTACDPRDVGIVVSVEKDHTNWSLKTNETN